VEAAGIAPTAPIHQVVLTIASARSTEAPGSEIGRNRETPTLDLVEMVVRWPSLPSPIVHATLALARSPAHLVARWIAHNLRASVRRHRSAPLPGRASDRQGASPSWLMSASNAGCDQSGRGAPPLNRNGEPDPCLLGSPAGRDKGRNAFRKALRKETRELTTGLVALP